MEPVSVSRHNRKQVLKNLYGDLRKKKSKAPTFKIGDVVRINKQKLHIEQGYEQNWRRELFTVYENVQRIPIVYRLKDLQGEEITENKISHFKTQLPSSVYLNGEWEVGLSEMIYPHSWLNVNETNNYFRYKVGDGNISSTVKQAIDSRENFKEAVKTRSRESGNKLAQKAVGRVQSMVGNGQYKRKRCVDNEAFHGAFSKSPYEFKHFNLNFIRVYVDGQPVPHNPIELDFSKDQYIRAYQTLFVGIDRMGQDRGEHLSLIKHSNLRLELKFSKSLEQTVCVNAFTEFENELRKKVGEGSGKKKRVDLTVSSKKKKTQLSTSAKNFAAAPESSTTVPEYSAIPENSTAFPENSDVVPEKIFFPPKETESSFQNAYKTFDLPNNDSSLGIKESFYS
ncbi:chromo domain-containing protein [Trichonephila clavipes]|nr:chromo domain-containing protein [Trichonephila clavipes]